MKKRRRGAQPRNMRWIVAVGVAAILVVAGLIVGSLIFNRPGAAASSSVLSQCGTPVCGQASAPVTIEIYSDFQ
jgi:hypothetical protein